MKVYSIIGRQTVIIKMYSVKHKATTKIIKQRVTANKPANEINKKPYKYFANSNGKKGDKGSKGQMRQITR